MALQFHPLVFGLMLVVAAGTVAYTFWSSPSHKQSYGGHQSRSYDIPQKYSIGYDTNMRKSPPPKKRKEDKCCICLDSLEDDLKTLPCLHVFHSNCVSGWLSSNYTCPICRKMTF